MQARLTEQIGDELVVRTEGRPPRHRLEFDPTSGELVVRRSDAPIDPGVTPVDQIASDGFA